ncbi:hypothetical protein QR680_009891 [Steinernema hermaphroditum]|uniref:Uncharacterized protein n=1 Tax=Steinernema hermaphroditum TaxID=289476 RepID=A0AA39IM02_9BILA|nr:hypothetical protein QR680_009891 [Steinernema hermaphroditum]
MIFVGMRYEYGDVELEDVLREIGNNVGIRLSVVHRRLEKRIGAPITFAQINEVFHCEASSLFDAYLEGLGDYVTILTDPFDSHDVVVRCDGRISVAELQDRIRRRRAVQRWKAFLLLCCPIYESTLWDQSRLFLDERPTLLTLNRDLGTKAQTGLSALCEVFPDIVLVMDVTQEENLIFYPADRPKLSRDYLYFEFFQIVRRREKVKLSEICREMKLRHGVELDVRILRRLFHSNQSNPLDIIRRNPYFPRDKFHVSNLPSADDLLISVPGLILPPKCTVTKSTQTEPPPPVRTNIVENMIEYLRSSGGISLMATDVQKVMNRSKSKGDTPEYTYGEAFRSAKLMVQMSSGRLEMIAISGVVSDELMTKCD